MKKQAVFSQPVKISQDKNALPSLTVHLILHPLKMLEGQAGQASAVNQGHQGRQTKDSKEVSSFKDGIPITEWRQETKSKIVNHHQDNQIDKGGRHGHTQALFQGQKGCQENTDHHTETFSKESLEKCRIPC